MHRPSLRLPGPTDHAAPWIGANFWSRAGGPLMWRTFDPALVRAELAVLREHGLTFTRSFFYWPDFMPEPDRIDERCAAHYATFLDLHTELDMATIPTLFVGHMSGENWDPAWRKGRDLYRDVWMVARQAWFGQQMAQRYAAHPAVAGWLLTNEMPIYGGRAPREIIESWARIQLAGLRAGGATQPISLGDGAWGKEISGRDNGFSLHDQSELCDFIGPHSYPMGDDPVRQHYTAAFTCELATAFDRPVILEEFGVTSDFVSEQNAAHYYRQVLHNSLLAGATGWGAWNNTDFDGLEHQDPYRHHPFELHFGITDATGAPKGTLRELHAFAEVLADVDHAKLHRAESATALLVSSFLDVEYPFTEAADGPAAHENLRQAYVSARLSDLHPALVRESAGLPGRPDATLYLVPSTKALLSPTWPVLEGYARAGATVYHSFFPGAHMNQRGPWHNGLNAVFGVEQQLLYGLCEQVHGEKVVFTFTGELGTLGEGDTLSFVLPEPHAPFARVMLPVVAADAEILAVDEQGRPALLRRRVGQGSIILCTYPLEHLAAGTALVNPDAVCTLYDALATAAGVERPVRVEDPRVACDVMVHEDGTRYAWLVSQADEALTVKPVVPGVGLPPGEETTTLQPYGVAVLRLR
ncbi:MAG TPA: cellulase family glycosylhydrolase [Actinospica sp.]|jgi:endo-1,4-beta-mannosidase|nr:cellulase family glycosylhydrolase [Actinospica sp.]